MSTNVRKSNRTSAKKIVLVGVFGAISTVLMLLSLRTVYPNIREARLLGFTSVAGWISSWTIARKLDCAHQSVVKLLL